MFERDGETQYKYKLIHDGHTYIVGHTKFKKPYVWRSGVFINQQFKDMDIEAIK